MAAEAVKVIVRCRPMNDREKNLKCEDVIQMDPKRGLCQIKNPTEEKATPKNFTFDGAYYVESTTEQIYNDIGYPLVEGVTEGYNGTIFAYGQTGCGKSFTMQGVKDPPKQRGVIPRAFDHIFETISVADQTKFLVHASFCEIYNEEIRDLLGKDAKAKLELKEHPDRGVYVQGLSMHPVHNVTECEHVMEKGWKNRSTGATLMNSDSSRSHSIFSIHLEMITKDDEGEEHIRAGKLNLVDLAGSERQAKTGATGDRLKEATKINLSLSALGNVISALVDGKSKHIPYRDSKLTRLLQDSLGGNTKTLMVACLSPADNNYDETLSTLRYANRAKNIKNKPKINEDPKDALLREYQEEIQRLKAMLTGQLPVAEVAPASKPRKGPVDSEESIDSQREDLEREKERIRMEYDQKLEDMQARYEEEKVNKNKLQDDMSKLRVFYDERLAHVDGQLSDLPSTAEVLGEVDWSSRDKPHRPRLAEKPSHSEGTLSDGSLIAASASPVGDSVSRAPEEDTGAPRAGPGNLGSLQRPLGPVSGTLEMTTDEGLAVEVASITSTDYPEDGSGVRSGGREFTPPQRAVHLSTSKGEDGVILAGMDRNNLPPEHMQLLKSSDSKILTKMHKEAVDRLHELQMQMVGGENAHNEELKLKHLKRIQYADERSMELARAINAMDDDGIMMNIYHNLQDDVYTKTNELDDAEKKILGLKLEIKDIQAEFEMDRQDLLDTIRKQEKQMKLYMALIDRIQPCVRRDCNYFNIDKVKSDARWDEENGTWNLPKVVMERAPLPNAGVMPGGRLDSKTRSYGMEQVAATDIPSDDRLRRRLEQGSGSSYFQPKRASQLLSHPPPDSSNLPLRKSIQPLGHSNGVSHQQDRFSFANGSSGVNGTHQNNNTRVYQNGLFQEEMTTEQRAAFVHGTVNSPEEMLIRRPQRLESLSTQTGKKSKKKRNALEPI